MELEDVLELIKENNKAVAKDVAAPIPAEQLLSFVEEQSVKLPKTTQTIMLYSGPLQPDGNGLYTYHAANGVAGTSPNLGVVDNTSAMKLVSDDRFKEALKNSVGPVENTKVLYGTTAPDGTRITPGLFDKISGRFVAENAHLSTVTMTPFAKNSGVYVQTELPLMTHLDGGNIEGLPRHIFKGIALSSPTGLYETRLAVSALSTEQMGKLKYAIDENGALVGVDTSKAWGGQFGSSLPDSSAGAKHTLVSQADLMQDMPSTQKSQLIRGADIVDNAAPGKADFSFLRRLGKNAGLIGGAVIGGLTSTFALATGSSKAEAAEIFYESAVPYGETELDLVHGDLEAAKRSGTVETASNVGGAGGALAGAAIGTMILPGVGTVVGGVIGGIGGGVGTGYITEKVYDNYAAIKNGTVHLAHEAAESLSESVASTKRYLASWFDDDPALDVQTAYARLPDTVTADMPPEVAALVEVKASLELFQTRFSEIEDHGSLSEVVAYIESHPQEAKPSAPDPENQTLHYVHSTAPGFG